MARIQKKSSRPARATQQPAPKKAAKSAAPARNAAALTTGDNFGPAISPTPLAAEFYKVVFANRFNNTVVGYGGNTGSGGYTAANVAEAGKPLFIDYSRLPEDIGLPGTLKKVELFYRIDGGPVQSATIAEGEAALKPGLRTPFQLDVPAGAKGEVEYWFKLTTEGGQEHYDSSFGNNYRTNILPAASATVTFDDLWGETVTGPIKAGSSLRLAYDVDRIKPLLNGTSHHGVPTWNAVAYVSFDGQPPQEIPLTAVRYGNYGTHSAVEPVEGLVEIPVDAKKVTVWIKGRAYGGSAFDSDFGKNYSFDVVP